jgi:hypothetical protein
VIECFLIEPIDYVRRSLRRFAFTSQRQCFEVKPGGSNPFGCCDASIVIDPMMPKPQSPDHIERAVDWKVLAGHPDWPRVCSYCFQPFTDEHQWQVNEDRLYENSERGVRCTLRDAPPGAMWWAHWCQDWGSIQWKARGGGPHLFVMTPGGVWDIDQGCRDTPDGNGWERTGEPPEITARPSILISDRYHGFLTGGVLQEC